MPSTTRPDIVRAVDRFRRDLLRRDRAASTQMVRYYGQIWKRIRTRVDDLIRRHQEAVATGRVVTSDWLFQMNRLRALQEQVEIELLDFARYAEASILVEQREAIRLAQEHTATLLQISLPKKVVERTTFQRLPTAELETLVGFLQDGSPLYDLLLEYGTEGARATAQALTAGLAMGLSPRETARSVKKAFGGNLTRALVVARTETLRAYRETSRRSFQANGDLIEGWIWYCGLDARTCAACWAMHGTHHPVTEILDDHPNGRCAMIPITRPLEEIGDSLGVDFTGIKDRKLKVEPGTDLFRKLPKNQQRAILGTAKYAAYKAGALDLPQLVGRTYNRRWGSHRYERSLRSILGDDAKKYYAGKTPDNT